MSMAAVSIRRSGSRRDLVRVVDPGHRADLAARALAYRPLTSRSAQTSTGVDRCTSQVGACRGGVVRSRTVSRVSAYGAITGTSTITPFRASSSATKPIRVHLGVAVLAGEAEAGREMRADLVAVEHLDAAARGRAAGRPAHRRWWSCRRSAGR